MSDRTFCRRIPAALLISGLPLLLVFTARPHPARYRGGPGKAEMLKPGEPYEFTIEMYPTSLVFKRGHRIRVDISSSNFPRFDVNPNTGEPLNANRSWRMAENTVLHDRRHASHIILPVIP